MDLKEWEDAKLNGDDSPPPKKPQFDPPHYDFGAHLILRAFNVVARARRYENGVPLPLCMEDVQAYSNLFDLPVEENLFIECVFDLDDAIIDKAHKRIENEAVRTRNKK